jgi:hypothetical protein
LIKYFRQKFGEKMGRFLLKPLRYFLQTFDHNIGFEKNANFLAKIWQKSPKIVIIICDSS